MDKLLLWFGICSLMWISLAVYLVSIIQVQNAHLVYIESQLNASLTLNNYMSHVIVAYTNGNVTPVRINPIYAK